MEKKIKNKSKMKALEKTKKVYGTISEEAAKEKFKDEEKEKIEEKVKEETEVVKEAVKEEKKRWGKERKVEEAKANLEAWIPKTKLGKEVKNKKIKNIDEIFDNNRKILEAEIVDILLPIKSDLIAIGQAKGKFGGGKRRAWRQTQRVTQEGGVMTFSAMAVVGDENGHIGIGVGKAGVNIMKIKRGCSAFDCSCEDPHSIPFVIEGKAGSVRIKLMPAPQGTGLVVARELKKVLKLAGIKDVYSKTEGNIRTTFNLIKAGMDALKKTNRQ